MRRVPAVMACLILGCSAPEDTTSGTTTDTEPEITCDPSPAAGPVPFVDGTAAWGLDFVHHDESAFCDIRDTVGGPGVCSFDYDGDGDVDLYFVDRESYPNRLYRNDGGHFTDVTEQTGTGLTDDSHSCLAFDYDSDGDLDLFVGNSGEDKLLRNDGGVFTDVTAESGLAEKGYSTTATAADIDADGDLDLFVGHLVTPETCFQGVCSPPPKACTAEMNSLYLNVGGKFQDVTAERHLTQIEPTLASLFFDFDADGDVDLFVGNDMGTYNPDRLFKNDGQGHFNDATGGHGLENDGTDTMGVDVGDADGDGMIDLVVSDFRQLPTRLILCPRLELPCKMVGINQESTAAVKWGIALADFDQDRDLDIFTTAGEVEVSDSYVGDLHQLHHNDGKGVFTAYTPSPSEVLAEPHIGRGAAFADLDGDLDLDIIVANAAGPAQILINEGTNGYALMVELDTLSAGARVTVSGKDVERTQVAKIGGSYAGSSDPRVHFGMGDTCAADVTVEWTDGTKKTVKSVKTGQLVKIDR